MDPFSETDYDGLEDFAEIQPAYADIVDIPLDIPHSKYILWVQLWTLQQHLEDCIDIKLLDNNTRISTLHLRKVLVAYNSFNAIAALLPGFCSEEISSTDLFFSNLVQSWNGDWFCLQHDKSRLEMSQKLIDFVKKAPERLSLIQIYSK